MRNGGALRGAPSVQKEGFMKVTILRNTVAAKQSVKVGAVLDLPDHEARFLVNIGKAEVFTEVATVAPAAESNETLSVEAATKPAPAKQKKVK